MKKSDEAIKWCSRLLELDASNFDALCNRGEAKIVKEDYAAAAKDFENAHEINKQDRRVSFLYRLFYKNLYIYIPLIFLQAVEGYQRAQRLLKAAGRKDYYKILGVSRTATAREIKKAYRKLAQEWHPDKYRGDLDKETVLKKMSEINEAYETLTDEEKRARVDNGEDPNDNSQPQHPFFHQGGGGFHFHQGGGGFHFQGNPFGGGGGGGFKFQF